MKLVRDITVKLSSKITFMISIPIIQTGINKYLDFFIKDYDSSIEFFIANQGRKCDLDILVRSKNEAVKKLSHVMAMMTIWIF